MKAVVAIDSFKGCLTSLEAGQAAKEGILRVYPDAQVALLPLADGGEGTVEAWEAQYSEFVSRVRWAVLWSASMGSYRMRMEAGLRSLRWHRLPGSPWCLRSEEIPFLRRLTAWAR